MTAAHRRHDMGDAVRERLRPHLPGGEGKHGRPAHDNRRFIGAVCWTLRTGSPWPDLPLENDLAVLPVKLGGSITQLFQGFFGREIDDREITMPFYEGFESLKIDTSGGATINLVKGGRRPSAVAAPRLPAIAHDVAQDRPQAGGGLHRRRP